jgi:hypothetical protein
VARVLGGLVGITPVHLDGLYYDRDWKPLDKKQFTALRCDLVTAPRWIIDGNYASALPFRLEAAGTAAAPLPGTPPSAGRVEPPRAVTGRGLALPLGRRIQLRSALSGIFGGPARRFAAVL